MKLSTFFILIFSSLIPFVGFADCTLNNTQNPNGNNLIGASLAGQQFFACQTGNITSIQIQTSGGDIDLYLVKGNGSSITIGNTYEVFPSQPAGLVTLNLTIPFATTAGEEYAFAIGNVTEVTFDNLPVGVPKDPSVPNGGFSFEITNANVFSEIFLSDLVFGVQIASPPPVPVIPSLSSWGLLILGLLILNLSLLSLKNKKMFKI